MVLGRGSGHATTERSEVEINKTGAEVQTEGVRGKETESGHMRNKR